MTTSNRTDERGGDGSESSSPKHATTSKQAASSEEAPRVLRSYTLQAPCEGREDGAVSFWLFQALAVGGLIGGTWLMQRRRRVVQSIHHRRMERMVNS